MINAIPKSDIVITATGNKDIISGEHFFYERQDYCM